MVAKYDPLANILTKPEPPVEDFARSYPTTFMNEAIDWQGILDNIVCFRTLYTLFNNNLAILLMD